MKWYAKSKMIWYEIIWCIYPSKKAGKRKPTVPFYLFGGYLFLCRTQNATLFWPRRTKRGSWCCHPASVKFTLHMVILRYRVSFYSYWVYITCETTKGYPANGFLHMNASTTKPGFRLESIWEKGRIVHGVGLRENPQENAAFTRNNGGFLEVFPWSQPWANWSLRSK